MKSFLVVLLVLISSISFAQNFSIDRYSLTGFPNLNFNVKGISTIPVVSLKLSNPNLEVSASSNKVFIQEYKVSISYPRQYEISYTYLWPTKDIGTIHISDKAKDETDIFGIKFKSDSNINLETTARFHQLDFSTIGLGTYTSRQGRDLFAFYLDPYLLLQWWNVEFVVNSVNDGELRTGRSAPNRITFGAGARGKILVSSFSVIGKAAYLFGVKQSGYLFEVGGYKDISFLSVGAGWRGKKVNVTGNDGFDFDFSQTGWFIEGGILF